MENLFQKLREKVEEIKGESEEGSEVLERVAGLLRREVEHYDWVGFYLADGEEEELILGPYDGEPTEHVRIDYGEGICGQSAETRETFIVQDVAKENNYLSCSPKVKSEIVVPVFVEDEFVGEIDIDSHEIDPFSSEDEVFLKALARELAPFF
ncbi:GAF domain-containing protein [Candidatus Bipolaricaulota bacterium]|nr:GAF domain-containing protein [Candidatus Bipolaricaulota bacterium]